MYNIGDAVYLRDSAAIGFLECYAVSQIHILPGNDVVYELSSSFVAPTTTPLFGDRVTHRVRPVLNFRESELITKNDAIDLAKSALEIQLAALESLR